MHLKKSQKVIRIRNKEGLIYYHDMCSKIRSFVALIDDNGQKRVMTSKNSAEEDLDEMNLTIYAKKKRVKFVTIHEGRNNDVKRYLQGSLLLVYTDESHLGLFIIQARYCEESNDYETVQTYIDLLDGKQAIALLESILKACAFFGDETIQSVTRINGYI